MSINDIGASKGVHQKLEMEMTVNSTLAPEAVTALTKTLSSALSATETPESMGRALYRHLLANAATQGQISADGGTIEMQVNAKVSAPIPSDGGVTERKVTVKLCISAFGYEIACIGSTIDDGNPV